jgi:hypothetical protein
VTRTRSTLTEGGGRCVTAADQDVHDNPEDDEAAHWVKHVVCTGDNAVELPVATCVILTTTRRSAGTITGSSSSPGGRSTSFPTAPSGGLRRPGAATTPNPPATPSSSTPPEPSAWLESVAGSRNCRREAAVMSEYQYYEFLALDRPLTAEPSPPGNTATPTPSRSPRPAAT